MCQPTVYVAGWKRQSSSGQWYLTGRKRALIHASNAAGFGFFDGRHMCFMKEELGKIGIQGKWLPEVCGAMQELGTYRNCIVTTAIGDNQTSFLGAVGMKIVPYW